MSNDGASESKDRASAFIELLAKHDRTLSIYVTGLIGRVQDAQDVIQEGKVVMWQNFDQFELGTNFVAWARQVLFYQVLAYRRKHKKDGVICFSAETLSVINEEAESQMLEQKWLDREEALEGCIKKLDKKKQELVHWRYCDELSVEEIGGKIDKEKGAVYRTLSRLRRTLYECVELEMKKGTITESL